MNPDFIIQVATILVAGGVTYGAIKSDLKNLHEKIIDVKMSTDSAHERIDTILTAGGLDRRNEK